MRTPKCNEKCRPDEGLHWLGDRMMKEGERKCVGCGAIGQPHYGFSSPCSASQTGAHYFTKETVELNRR